MNHHQKRVVLHLVHHSVILIFSVIIAVFLHKLGFFNPVLALVGKLKIFGAFLGGILYASGITVGPSAVFLVNLAKSNSVMTLSVVGGLGVALGDIVLSRLVLPLITSDIREALESVHNGTARGIIRSAALKWALPIIGFMIIVSPLPDEIGLALLGLSNFRFFKLFPLLWVAHSVGIFFLITVGQAVI